MKSYRSFIIPLSVVSVGTLFLLAAGEAQTSVLPGPQADNAELKMSIVGVTAQEAKGTPTFRVTLENVGNVDAVLNLGAMLANGRVHVPTEIRLILTDSGGESKELHYSNARVAGRVDDYAVPLRAGSAYTLKLTLDDFWCPETKEVRLKLKSGVYRVRSEFTGKGAQFVNKDTTEAAKLMNFWKGTLQSDPTVFRIGEQG